MESNNPPTNFVLKNWGAFAAFCGILFALGGLYSEVKEMKVELAAEKAAMIEHKKDAEKDHNNMMDKQERKWGDIEEIEQRVDDLEETGAYEKGKQEAQKK
jgi:predicted Holliday junction resolvase-like endonuclease